MKIKNNQNDRARVWQFIMYPESAPEDPFAVLREFHTPFVVSPLHDKDVENGILKKTHWHVIFIFDGMHSYDQVKVISDSVNAAPPVRVLNVRGAVRYLIHLDDPEKYQYHLEELKAFCGLSVSKYFAFSSDELDQAIHELEGYILEYNVFEFCDLVEYSRINEPAWHYVLCKTSTNYFKTFLSSRRHKVFTAEKKGKMVIDENGEVIC